jgi:hypothetical protein
MARLFIGKRIDEDEEIENNVIKLVIFLLLERIYFYRILEVLFFYRQHDKQIESCKNYSETLCNDDFIETSIVGLRREKCGIC